MDESRTIRVSVEEAATLLGIEKGSVKKRIQRGKIRSEKDDSGTTWVYLDRSETVQDQSQGPSETTDLLYEEMRSRIAYLERQVEEEREARRRADTLLARLMDNIPALEAPESREEGAQEPAETGAGGPNRPGHQAVQSPQNGLGMQPSPRGAGR
jgi:hypothetical protein